MVLSTHAREQVAKDIRRDLVMGTIQKSAVEAMFEQRLANPQQGVRRLSEAIADGTINRWDLFSHLLKDASQGRALFAPNMTKDILTSAPGSGYAYIREDVDPTTTALYINTFPGWERLGRRPANGIHHSFNVRTGLDIADVSFMTELQAAPIGQAPPTRVTSPVSLAGTTRGASWLENQAVAQGGVLPDGQAPAQEEVMVGFEALGYYYQRAYYQGVSFSAASGSAGTNTPYGIYNASGFNGLRVTLENPANVASSLYLGGTAPVVIDQAGMSLVAAINRVARKILNNNGHPSAIHLSYGAAEALAQEGAQMMRIDSRDANGVTLGLTVDAVNTIAGPLPLVKVPGDSIGYYAAPAGSIYSGGNVEPVYVLDESQMFWAYLGAERPFTIQVPMGVDLSLADRTIIAYAAGLCVRAPSMQGLVRIPAVNNL